MIGQARILGNAYVGFFGTIKGERIDHESYPTREAAIAAIAGYVDGFHDPCRRHSALDYVSPLERMEHAPSVAPPPPA